MNREYNSAIIFRLSSVSDSFPSERLSRIDRMLKTATAQLDFLEKDFQWHLEISVQELSAMGLNFDIFAEAGAEKCTEHKFFRTGLPEAL